MDAFDFYGLQRTEDPNFWRLPVVPDAVLGPRRAVRRLRARRVRRGARAGHRPAARVGHRPVPVVRPPTVRAWTSGSPRSSAATRSPRPGPLATVDGDEILTVNAALGDRDVPYQGEWAVRPDVPPPEDCPPRADPRAARGHDHGPHRDADRRRPRLRRARRHAGRRPQRALGPAARRARDVRRGARDRR